MPRIGVGLGLGLRQAVAAAGGYDADAQAFFDRVTTAGGTLTTTEKNATNQLVLDMKSAGIWTAMKAIYPMVGASAAACAQNLKSASFTGTFTSGWTFSSTGVTGNGTSAYMDTTFKPLTNSIGLNSFAFGVYCRNNIVSKVAFGLTEINKNAYILANSTFGLYSGINDAEGIVTPNWSDGRGFFINSRTSSTGYALFQNITKKTRISVSIGVSDLSMLLGCYNQGPTINPANYSAIEFAFNFISDGLTDTQASNFYTAVQTFNQTLNRQVGAQIVSDADAQAYINRVYTAGGTLTNTEANAVNQLVIDMKAAGIWTAMKAVYPMVGASAAACAQNLKSSSFTGTFSSGWTFSSTGATPNGSSAYMNTNYLVSSSNGFSMTNCHLSHYSRTNSLTGGQVDMGAGIISPSVNFNNLYQYIAPNVGGEVGSLSFGTPAVNSLGFVIKGATSSTNAKMYKNGSLIQTINTTQANSSDINVNMVIAGQFNQSTVTNFSTRETAFASIGDGLNDTQAADFYTCVQNFNTTLSRQV